MASALRRPLAAFALAAALAAGSALVLREPAPVLSPGEPAPARLPETSRFALLAVGDTGETLPFRPFAEGQRSVARGLELEDRRAPVDALLLLGDNFYPKGLAEDELLERLRRNLVGPYCRFVDLRGSRSAEVADACRLPPAQRHPVPIFAVLGNHDHGLPESPALQQRAIPHYLPNWSLPAALASTTELAEGLSLVRIDSELARRAPERLGELRDAFARARGPWRILALHHPIAPRVGEDESDGFEADLRELLAELPEPVQLVLAGHRHNLQIRPLTGCESNVGQCPGGAGYRAPVT